MRHAVPTLDPAQPGTHVLAQAATTCAALLIMRRRRSSSASSTASTRCYGERRDRSILFWKSLPVSDLTTVLSKASIPLVVLPLIAFVVILATQFVMLLIGTAALAGERHERIGAVAPGARASRGWWSCSTAWPCMSLWYAPIYGWLLLVSAWARRATFLWAVLPLLALCVVEAIAFHTWHFAALLKYRLGGGFAAAFDVTGVHGGVPNVGLAQLDPVKFLGTPGLWTGLAVAAAFLAAAVWLRRYRGPI